MCSFTLWLHDGSQNKGDVKDVWLCKSVSDKSIDDLPKHLPMFIARAGQDQTPYLNEALDQFIVNGLERNMAITFANHPNGPHAFDLFDDSQTTRIIIRQVLDFLSWQLGSP